jgi:hypothetical protein
VGQKSKTQHFIEAGLGQHLALSVAAHLARSQLVPDPLKPCDAQHLGETLDLVARALAKVAPLYIQDPKTGSPLELSSSELEGAAVRRGATLLVLRDGRTISAVTVKRADLRQAIAILKATGIPELLPPRAPYAPEPQAGPPDLLALHAELEALVQIKEIEAANVVAVRIARNAPHGAIANLAMQLMTAVNEEREIEPALQRLRAALEQAAASGGPAPS